MTSLYQICLRREVVQTVTPRLKLVKRWLYIDIQKAMNPAEDRENAIVSVPEDRRIKSDFNRKIDLDLSTPELEYQNLMFPLNQVFDWDEWQDGFNEYWLTKDPETRKLFKPFKDEILQNFKAYQLPVIALGPDTSREAVCLVFEKVNTGGKPLDAFELVTAMYASRGHRLRDDWLVADGQPGLQTRLQLYGRAAEQKFGVLEKVAATDVLQAIAAYARRQKREAQIAAGCKESEFSAVRATRQSLLDLPRDAYLKHRGTVEEGFKTAARFLRQHHIYRVIDLPYQGQLVPFAAILAIIGPKFDHAAVRDRLARWFWCGIFGELYGSAIESRFAKDVLEVPVWLDDGPEPSTITDGRFRPERLRTLRTRLSAAYKGIHALLMAEGAIDFRSGQPFGQTVFSTNMSISTTSFRRTGARRSRSATPASQRRTAPSRWTGSATRCGPLASTSTTTSPPVSATTARDSTAACARSGRATCSSSGSSTALAAPSSTWSTPCRTCRPAAWACGCSPGKARRSTPPPPPAASYSASSRRWPSSSGS